MGAEFLELFRDLSGAAAPVFTRVWLDPTAYHWTRLAYDLLASVAGGAALSPAARAHCTALLAENDRAADIASALRPTDLRRALVLHLEEFKRFALAVGLISGTDTRFARPFETRLPLSLPGTRLVLRGPGAVAIQGVASGTLELVHEDARHRLTPNAACGAEPDGASRPVLVECPVAVAGDVELPLKPELFQGPGIALGAALTGVPEGFQVESAPLVARSLKLMRRHHPVAFAHFREIIRAIGLKPTLAGGFTNSSDSELPGAFVATVTPEPHLFTDTLVRELYHNRLFFLEELSPFFLDDGDNDQSVADFYSPWRDEPRPLHGILHAIYVNVPLWHLWARIRASGETSGATREMVEDQVARIALQLAIAVHELGRHARLSDFGARVHAELRSEAARIQVVLAELGLSHAVPLAMRCTEAGEIVPFEPGTDGRTPTALDVVREHVRAFGRRREYEDIESIVRSVRDHA